MNSRRHTRWTDLLIVAAAGVSVYGLAGVFGAYFARDDFQWLNGARTEHVLTLFRISGRSHFYRPVAEAWWMGASAVCGRGAPCFHGVMLSLHIVNALLWTALTARVFSRRDVALAAGVTFVVMPSYNEAVVWVCAVTTTLAMTWYLLALTFALTAAERASSGAALVLSAACMTLALYTHEATATLFATIPLVIWAAGRWRWPRVTELLPFGLAAAVFLWTTIAVNRHNYVFLQGHYEAGAHGLAHALGYLRTMYVGSAAPFAVAVAIVAVVAIVVAGTLPMRTGLAWIAITLLPYLWFTWGNVGRYTYLPCMGLAWVVGGAAALLRDRIAIRWQRPSLAAIAYGLIVTLVAGRFAVFARRAAADEVRWTDAYRAYANDVASRVRQGVHAVTVPAPADPSVEEAFVAPMLQWIARNPNLEVKVAPRR